MRETRLEPGQYIARSLGPLARGSFRVVVFEADGRTTHRDFTELEPAKCYAFDAAWQMEDGPVYAYVVDDAFETVHRPTRLAAAVRPPRVG